MSKLKVSMSKAAVEFLHSILNSEKVTNMSAMRKLNQAFKCLQPVYDAFHEEGKKIRDKYMEPTEVTAKDGTKTTKLVIPAAKSEAYQEEMEKLSKEKTEIEFDRESCSTAKVTVEHVFARPETKEGITGQQQLALLEEVLVALCGALDIDVDSIVSDADVSVGAEGGDGEQA